MLENGVCDCGVFRNNREWIEIEDSCVLGCFMRISGLQFETYIQYSEVLVRGGRLLSLTYLPFFRADLILYYAVSSHWKIRVSQQLWVIIGSSLSRQL